MEDHSPHVPEPSNDFEDVEFREDAMYIRYGQFGTWHEVQYTDTFSEQYDLVKPETGLE